MTQFDTYTNLISAATRRLRQVPGLQTQLYSETVIGSYIQEAYEILRNETWWPWMMKRVSGTLDGTTGKVAGTPWATAGLTDFDDIRAIYLDSYQNRLPMISEDVNPITVVGGQYARYVEPLSVHDDPISNFLFRIYPVTTVGTVYLWARVDPTGIFSTPTIVVPMNKYLLLNYCMWRYMTDDAANPGAAAAAIQAYEKLKDQEMSKINDQPIWLNPGWGQTNDQWQER
jgi:hypothetical protein